MNKLYEELLDVYNIQDVIDNSNNLIYETNNILPVPKQLFNLVKNKIQYLLSNNKSSIDINLKEALTDNFISNYYDNELSKTLEQLFNNHNNAYFTLTIERNIGYWFDKYGEYKLPKGFTENLIDNSTLHYSFPKIQKLILDDILVNKFVKQYKADIQNIKTLYNKKQKSLQIFKEHILDFDNFGEIVIYPDNCTIDDTNTDKPTLDEVIEHECQHLCIFLLSLAKTCIWFGLHFSNQIDKIGFDYQLKENEFITLFGSYCNVLIRIYKQIDNPKTINEFVKAIIELSIFDTSNQDKKYIEALNKSIQFSRIKKFYTAIFNDSNYSIYKRTNNKPITLTYFKNNKFKKLVNWTIKNIEENMK